MSVENVERWAREYIESTDLAHKRAPPPPPRDWEETPAPLRIDRPGRPPELRIAAKAMKTPGPEALRSPERRAQLHHTFLHHELQAAELMCWALLAFPEAPPAFRRGLLGIALDEVRHLQLYDAHLATLGHRYGDFPVRDWFWERVPRAATPAHFVATMGIGFEGANLDHAARFAERLRAAGDPEGAAIEARIGDEEVAHVRFALRWFAAFTGAAEGAPLDFDAWAAHLPAPLSPMLMRGAPVNRAERLRAGLPESFVLRLEQWI